MMFSADTIAISDAIGQIAMAALEGQDRDKVIAVGFKVALAVHDFRAKHPDRVPKTDTPNLLSPTLPSERPVRDFALAMHLVYGGDPTVTRLQRAAGDMDVLLAYLLVEVCLDDRPPVHIGLDEALQYATTASSFSLKDTKDHVRRLQPLAKHGEAFMVNRKAGRLSPVARRIKAYMQAHPRAKATDVWEALKLRPPKDHSFMETPRLGRYVEKGAKTVMAWPRFRNLVSEHRPRG